MKTLTLAQYETSTARTRPARLQGWKEARFGMFIHYGLYAILGRHEWARAYECIPLEEYDQLARKFRPRPGAARQWARLAKNAGMKYMVLTTKHHDGFCLWNSRQTSFNAWQAARRDIVAEFVQACREFDLRIGFYYSLMDWHHPDGAACAHDPAAKKRFLAFTQNCVRELLTHYGKIDILWYDVPEPLPTAKAWNSLAMNHMARKLQPHILINNRSHLHEDFSTPENHVVAPSDGRAWEACMTFNHAAWGYMPAAAADSHSARDIIKMLSIAAASAGNLLLNIGPKPDGSVPPESITPLKTVGQWLKINREAVYGDLSPETPFRATACAGAAGGGGWSRKNNILYCWTRFWPGKQLAIGGFQTALQSARFLATGKKIEFQQSPHRILLKNLPEKSPDKLCGVTVIALEFAAAPRHLAFASTPALARAFPNRFQISPAKAAPAAGRRRPPLPPI